ncbi:MAG: TonB-dependent receptor [Cellvibrio sp.]
MFILKKKLTLAVSAVMAGSFVTSMGAMAQPKALEEVIVTARKTEENIQAIPVAITSLSSENLVNQGITNVKAIGDATPSLTITQASGNPVSPRVSLRGQVQNDTVFTLDPSVGIYLDEIYLGRAPGAMLDLYDVQRVEILKGPQGTLYGRNTTGGAMKIITNKAETGGDLGGYLKAGAGSYSAKSIEGAINVPIIEDKLAARVAGLINKRDGYAENTIVNPITGAFVKKVDTGDKDTQSARFDLILNATDKFDVELQGDYSDFDTNGLVAYNKGGDLPVAPQSALTAGILPPGVPVGTPPFAAMAGNTGYRRSSNDKSKAVTSTEPSASNIAWGTALTATYTFDNDFVAKAVYGHRQMDGRYAFDVDGTSLGIASTIQDQGAKQNTVELQLTGNSFDSLDWVAGLYWFKETGYENSQSFSYQYAAAPLGAISSPYFTNGENKSKSAYGQSTWHFTDTLSLTTGVRWTADTKSLLSHNYTQAPIPGGFTSPGTCNFTAGTPGITIAPGVCDSDQSKSYKHISWTAGIDWQVTDETMVYVKSSNGYRAGGQNLRGKAPVELIPFDEETVTDIEVGAKSTLWDNRLRTNFAAYRSFYKDIQNTVFVNTGSPVLGTQVVNLSDAEINGAELEIAAQVLDQLVVNAAASYNDTAFTTNLTGSAATSYPLGLQAQYTPRWKYSLSANYTQPLSFGDLSYNLSYAWRDGYWANTSKANNQTPGARTDAVGLVNARISLELASIDTTIGLWGTNLADKEYVQNALVFRAGGSYTFVNTNPQEPRMFGVDVTKKF